MEGSGLYGEILPSLNLSVLIPRPGLPRTVYRVVMLLVFLILFFLGFDACLREVEIMSAVIASHGEGFRFLVKSLIAEEFGRRTKLHEVLKTSLFVWVDGRGDTYLISACLVHSNALGLKTVKFLITFAYSAALVEGATHLISTVKVRLITS